MGVEHHLLRLARIGPHEHHAAVAEPLPGDAKAIYHLADRAGPEGTVSKRRDSKYRSGRRPVG